jgi:hypothetical protein
MAAAAAAAAAAALKEATYAALPWHNTVKRLASSAFHGANEAATATISVMQFNLLALCFEHHTPDLTYQQRKSMNVAHIRTLQPTLLVTEETDADYFDEIEAQGLYSKVCAYKKEDSGEYTAVFIRNGSGLTCKKFEKEKIDPAGKRGQFCFFLHLAFAAGGKSVDFLAIAFHAKAGRGDELESTRMHDNAHILQALLPAFAAKADEARAGELLGRVMWLGDFNAGPSTYGGKYPARVIPWLLGGEYEPEQKAKLEHDGVSSASSPVAFVSAFADFFGRHPIFTTCKHREEKVICQCIDYILLSKSFGAKVTGALADPSQNPTEELMPTLLPKPKVWGSDHISQYVEISLAAQLK